MQADEVKTAADARAIVEERGLPHVKVGVFDVDGVMRGKYMAREKFFSALEAGGFGFCDVVLGWDSNDQLYDNVQVTGWHSGYGDAWVRLLPESCRDIATEDGMLLFLGEFTGRTEPVCPRSTLRRVVEYGQRLGLSATAACEFEFFVFNETPDSVRRKNYRELEHITPGCFGYSMLRSGVHAEFYEELLAACRQMRMPIEGLHTETGPGVLEAALQHTAVMEAADRAALFKTWTKIIAQRRGWMATFMAKWSPDWPGQSGHIHLSLQGENGEAIFYDEAGPEKMSTRMRHFIGGQQALMPELTAIIAPTVNSYTRLIPGFWAPTHASWGVENRTCALRAIPGTPKSQRVEYRITAADINPYIAMAAALGSGLWGIENEIEPAEPVVGSAYDLTVADEQQLPRSLMEAASRLRQSQAARELFGDAFVEHYAATREWEERQFRRHISDWELQRYFEII